MKKTAILFLCSIMLYVCCSNTQIKNNGNTALSIEQAPVKDTTIKPGIYHTQEYLELINNKRIAVVGNQTSIINNTHLVDTLLSLNQNIIKVLSPEHGFRGNEEAGKIIDNSIDNKTGIPIISLYGKNKKPTSEQMKDIEIVIFDLQDVGTRFYTYISTLHYIMESCAESNIPLIILDRPNPNAHYIDGPVLDTSKYRSFIGMHPVPVIYGMTIGEYGLMINGENWLKEGIKCDIKVIKCENYDHNKKYTLPVPPSPNLPNDRSIELYPTLCYFEGTSLSIGRGTDKQFQIIGHPLFKDITGADWVFIPMPNEGAKKPDLMEEVCYGFNLSENNSIFEISDKLNISLIKKVYELFPDKSKFFKNTNMFELLAGTSEFRKQIINNVSELDIRKSWEENLDKFKKNREKYLLYK